MAMPRQMLPEPSMSLGTTVAHTPGVPAALLCSGLSPAQPWHYSPNHIIVPVPSLSHPFYILITCPFLSPFHLILTATLALSPSHLHPISV